MGVTYGAGHWMDHGQAHSEIIFSHKACNRTERPEKTFADTMSAKIHDVNYIYLV